MLRRVLRWTLQLRTGEMPECLSHPSFVQRASLRRCNDPAREVVGVGADAEAGRSQIRLRLCFDKTSEPRSAANQNDQ
jgi:hypothetical protein